MSDDRAKARQPAAGDLPEDQGRDVDRANRRRELIATRHPGGARDYASGGGYLAQEWKPRDYDLRWPYIRGQQTASGTDSPLELACRLHGQASKPADTADAILMLSGITYAPGFTSDDSFEDMREKSVFGYVCIRVRPMQFLDGQPSPVYVDDGTPSKRYYPLHYVFAKRGKGSHYLHNQHWLLWQSDGSKQEYAYREGLLHMPGTDSGVWDQKTYTVDFGSDFDWRKPVYFEVELSIPFREQPFPEYPVFLDEETAQQAFSTLDDPRLPDPTALYCNILGSAVWSD